MLVLAVCILTGLFDTDQYSRISAKIIFFVSLVFLEERNAVC